MLAAPILENEDKRIKELYDYGILDTPPEFNLDEIVFIASYICHTPISLISIIDKERQWFKANLGLNAAETPRDISFCGHAIQQDEIFIVENTEHDERFKDNPLVTADPKIKFYAGSPLITSTGYKLGTLCVIDYKPSKLNSDQERILKALAKLVIQNFEMKKLFKKIQNDEKNLIQHAKMLSLGEMASGIAHEINNPLMIITGKTHLMKEYIKENKTIDGTYLLNEIEKIEVTKDRIKDIISNLRLFAKNSEKEPLQPYSILGLLNETLLLCNEKIKNRSIEINIEHSENVKNIYINCKPNHIRQAFLNLLLNAYDALETVENKVINISFQVLSDRIKISFIDNGVGISKENRENLMKPFFTTKEVGKGIGLGLCSTKGIIEEHKGIFYLDTIIQNTCFVIELPR
ncbi:GAF domain-containing sensor histidine kinase [Pigmentibacter sp. JX0631]|uniref:GAF domain-containing sensor histidine kinase n=1 Tax=Pigmentibacter sp. JX0631 TaxID=2976982 RepID=UPI002468B13F|nr:GAF domain-containing sensor histidine kinase [Pigmentibacter sp. JX0631]WGL58945.1 GAF domain-containing sensor histidine kinase [Pigmentibacter sp. JX0631]